MKPFIYCLLFIILFSGCQSASFQKGPAWDRFIDNSKQVRVAKRSYQIGHGLPDGTPVTWRDLTLCLPAQWKPICLEGGEIEPGNLGEKMKCSIHGELPDRFFPRRLLD